MSTSALAHVAAGGSAGSFTPLPRSKPIDYDFSRKIASNAVPYHTPKPKPPQVSASNQPVRILEARDLVGKMII